MRMLAFAAGLTLLAACDDPALMTADPALPALVLGTPPAAAPATRTITPAAAPDATFDAALNAWRRQAGLPAATPDARLIRAAQAHAEDMAANGYFNHIARDGRTHVQRATAQGYPRCPMAENLAYGQSSSQATFAEWAASPQHASNMAMRGPLEYGFGRSGDIYVLLLARVC